MMYNRLFVKQAVLHVSQSGRKWLMDELPLNASFAIRINKDRLDELARIAEANRRSTNQEVRARLEWSLRPDSGFEAYEQSMLNQVGSDLGGRSDAPTLDGRLRNAEAEIERLSNSLEAVTKRLTKLDGIKG
jgi:hypothetical protein